MRQVNQFITQKGPRDLVSRVNKFTG